MDANGHHTQPTATRSSNSISEPEFPYEDRFPSRNLYFNNYHNAFASKEPVYGNTFGVQASSTAMALDPTSGDDLFLHYQTVDERGANYQNTNGDGYYYEW